MENSYSLNFDHLLGNPCLHSLCIKIFSLFITQGLYGIHPGSF